MSTGFRRLGNTPPDQVVIDAAVQLGSELSTLQLVAVALIGNFVAGRKPCSKTVQADGWHVLVVHKRNASRLIILIGLEGGRPDMKSTSPIHSHDFVPTSVVLQRLHDEAPKDHFTLGWLMGSLQKRSFGIIMLLLAVVAIAPGVSIVAGLLLMIPAFQMMAGQPAPVFPRRIAAQSFPTRHLAALVQRAVPVLRFLEKVVRPRWPTPLEATKRLVGTVIVILNLIVVFVPIPLSNVAPALVIALISLAYLEEDGVLLSIALLIAAILLAVAATAIWQLVLGAKWLSGFG
jgi:hypothetical protein